jgi:hypothetical protein
MKPLWRDTRHQAWSQKLRCSPHLIVAQPVERLLVPILWNKLSNYLTRAAQAQKVADVVIFLSSIELLQSSREAWRGEVPSKTYSVQKRRFAMKLTEIQKQILRLYGHRRRSGKVELLMSQEVAEQIGTGLDVVNDELEKLEAMGLLEVQKPFSGWSARITADGLIALDEIGPISDRE